MLHVFAITQMLIHVLLNLSEIATNDLHQLGRQMLCIQRVHTPQNELVHNRRHILLNLQHSFLLLLGSIGFTPTKDGIEHLPSELFLSTKGTWIRKIYHGKEFFEIILHGGAGQQDTTFDGYGIECHGGLIFFILESMSFITNEEITTILILVESTYMCPECLIAYDQNVEHFRLDETIDVLLDSLTI